MAHDLPPRKIAFILDNTVIDVLHTDEKLGAIFLSEPTIIDVTDNYDLSHGNLLIGYQYIDGKFIPPQESLS